MIMKQRHVFCHLNIVRKGQFNNYGNFIAKEITNGMKADGTPLFIKTVGIHPT